MAPESLSSKTHDGKFSGKAADLWSLGVTLYCIVYKILPFNTPSEY